MSYKKVLTGLYHTAAYCVGAIVLLVAISVTLIRLALPAIGEYRHEIQAWVSDYMGYPVVIRTMQADWKGWTPQLSLTDIDLLDKTTNRRITGFAMARIEIDPLPTLLQRQFIPRRLIISGMQLAITRLASGAILIEGVNIDAGASHTDHSELADWLFKQHRIVIQNADIVWTDTKHQQPPIQLSHVSLTLQTDNGRIQIDGDCELPAEYGRSMTFAFDAVGDLPSSDWSGDMYLEAHEISLDDWPDHWPGHYRLADVTIAGGQADMKLWGNWQEGHISNIQGELRHTGLVVRAGTESLPIDALSYRFYGQRNQHKDWHLRVMLDDLLTENGHWPPSHIEMAMVASPGNDNDYRLTVGFDYLKLDDLLPLLSQWTDLPAMAKDLLLAGDISGELGHGSVVYERKAQAEDVFFYDLAFTRLQTDFPAALANISGLTGRLKGSNNTVRVDLEDDNLRFMFADKVQPDIVLTRLDGRIQAVHAGGKWRVETDDLALGNPDHAVKLQANIHNHTHDNTPELNLFASLHTRKIDKLHELIPASSKFKLKHWLERAVQGGNLDSAQIVFRGNPALFPFRHREGQLQGIINISDVILAYSPHWPEINELTAEVLIDNQRVTTTAVSGKLLDADILSGGVVHIQDISQKPKRVALSGRLAGTVADLNGFINTSPLQHHKLLAPTINNLTAGQIALDINTLMAVKSKKIKPQIDGTVHFTDAALLSQNKKIRIDQINGPVTFTRTSVRSNKLTAMFDGQPVSLRIEGPEAAPGQLGSITLSGRSDQDFITEQLQSRAPPLAHLAQTLNQHLQGELSWQATLSYSKDKNNIAQHLRLSSDLDGMAISLPYPLGKSAGERKPLSINRPLSAARTVTIDYNDKIQATFTPPTLAGKTPPSPARVDQQPRQPANDKTGLLIRGATDKLNFQDWFDTIREFSHNTGKQTGVLTHHKTAIDLDIDALDFYGQHIEHIHIAAERRQGDWQIQPTAFDVSGTVHIPAQSSGDHKISARLDKLAVKKKNGNGGSGQTMIADPLTFPALDIQVDDFVFHGMPLGKLHLLALRDDDGIQIEKITLAKPGLTISARGNWQGAGNRDNSRFTATLHADEIAAMLETFNYDGSPMRRGETDIQLKAEWAGSPMDFALEKMNGKLIIEVSKGQILAVEPSAGRLFGLLSLQTLPRRLSLDFSDLLGKGLAFDRIEGNFTISRGNAYTNDLRLIGPAANLAISGRAGLAQQDYDQLLTITPQIADTLPVASALLGPLGMGVGAVLYLAGNMFESINNSIDKMLSYQYSIIGPWQNPTIERLTLRNTERQNQLSQLPGKLPDAAASPN